MKFEMKMPDLAATDSAIKVLNWLVEVGHPVRQGQAVIEVETDKATMEVESTVNGTLAEKKCGPNTDVDVGQVIAIIEIQEHRQPVSSPDAEMTPEPQLANYDHDFLLKLYEQIFLIRRFEDQVKFLFLEGNMPGTIHQCHGQEATAVGVCTALNKDDFITSTFRGHGHALAKGLTPREMLDELFGATTGCCKGKGGSMHMGNMEKGMIPGIAIVAGGIPLAAGMALAFKMRKTHQVVACFFGDGAVAEGAFHEGLNMAAIWNLPVLFACENNLYGASTRIDKVMKKIKISDRAAAYGFHGETVDGNDLLAVYEAARRAVEECRAGQGPVLLELLTYRRTGHSRRDACHYQSRDEQAAWFSNDPIERFVKILLTRSDIGQIDLDRVKARVDHQVNEAVRQARSAPQPATPDLLRDVYA
jgi:TPP-dependent pyruvate/acetoin dehydrogenase alpha subunit